MSKTPPISQRLRLQMLGVGILSLVLGTLTYGGWAWTRLSVDAVVFMFCVFAWAVTMAAGAAFLFLATLADDTPEQP